MNPEDRLSMSDETRITLAEHLESLTDIFDEQVRRANDPTGAFNVEMMDIARKKKYAKFKKNHREVIAI